MKWLRSSLFKDNKDKFFFEEKLNISLKNFDSSLEDLEDVCVKGVLTRSGQDKIYVDINISGIYKVISSRTLNLINVPFEIEEQDEFIDTSFYDNDNLDYDFNTMDMFIDISNLVRELIILNVPTSYHLEDEKILDTEGKDWSLVSDEDFNEEPKKDNPFSVLSDMFKEK